MSQYDIGDLDYLIGEYPQIGRGLEAAKNRIRELEAERDQWKAGSAHVNGALLKRIAELEAALRLVREWADGACPYFDKGREADILGAEAETAVKPDPIYDELHAEHLKICPLCNPSLRVVADEVKFLLPSQETASKQPHPYAAHKPDCDLRVYGEDVCISCTCGVDSGE